MTDKLKKTLFIAVFVSVSAQINTEFFTKGFIIAMSVLVMNIFIYCYEDLEPTYIAFCSGIFSPLFRLFVAYLDKGYLDNLLPMILPDMVFFFTYGFVFPMFLYFFKEERRKLRIFPYVVFLSEILSNIAELGARSYIAGENLVSIRVIAYLMLISLVRVILLQVILLAIDRYSSMLIKSENEKEYRKLLLLAGDLRKELHLMTKNAIEVEHIMKASYEVYQDSKRLNLPDEMRRKLLHIAQNAHEVKGDFQGIVKNIQQVFVSDYEHVEMSIKDIIAIQKSELLKQAEQKGLGITINVNVRNNFKVYSYFKMMAIVGNLMKNAVDAIGLREGKIDIRVRKTEGVYVISVKDNGDGINPDMIDAVFYPGFSTKFNEKTGEVARGIGLSTVKEYVEDFGGSISVDSEVGKYTEFIVKLDPNEVEEVGDDEYIYSR